ncbi:MAG TPA: YidB family protein [Nitrospirota bacterium]|nr:YidB family protein [Nitrospirota bacterium]
MSILDQLKEGLAAKLGGGSNVNSIVEHAMNLINNPATGGLAGLVETFKSKGLGDVISSWISTGENKLISPDQIKQALGSDKIQQIAEKVGISKDAVSQHLSALLPQIIDKLTPDGNLPDAGKLGEALNMLKSKFFSS